MAKILVLGADGMVGHIARIYLSERGHEVCSIARSESEVWDRLDVEDLPAMRAYLAAGRFDIIVVAVGILIKESAADPVRAIRLNALLPQYLGSISKEFGFRVIHASTDCVFSGGNGPYVEDSVKDSQEVYGRTKSLGEVNNDHDITIRTSKVGPELDPDGSGLFHWFMSQKGIIRGFGRALWGGVTTLEYAKAIDWLIDNPRTGLVHLTNGEGISKYDLLSLFAEIWGKKDVTIQRDDVHASDRSLLCTRKDFDYPVPSYREMLEELYKFMKAHKALYTLYSDYL